MRVFIQRSADGLFLTPEGVWGATKGDAKDFGNRTPAINYCVEHGLAEVRLWLSFDDSKYDFPMEVFRAETRILVNYTKEMKERGRAVLAQMDSVAAAAKERKKQFAFPRKTLSDEGRMDADTPCDSSGATGER